MQDPQNELVLDTLNSAWWCAFTLFLTGFVTILHSEYEKYQVVLNERARLEYDGRS